MSCVFRVHHMFRTSFETRRRYEGMSADALSQHQLARLNQLFASILPGNRFYAEKLADMPVSLDSLDDLRQLPYTFKEELVGKHRQHLAANLTLPEDAYVRFHRTSGTHGRPMVVLDTAKDWQWWIDTWQYVLDSAQVTSADRAMLAFSFGPFIGFWSAHDALVDRGAMTIPAGGLNSLARLELIFSSRASVLCCTPTYALHLAEVAEENQMPLTATAVSRVIVAGEPGGSVPSIRQRIESAWDAVVIDHGGASEVGPWGYADTNGRGLHVIESEFLVEFLSVETGEDAAEGELSELVITTLGRFGCPVIRYRTGDLVRPTWNADGPNRFVFLDGGVLGRTDDMLIVRGVNIFPSAVEQILRSFPEIVEYRMIALKDGEMDALRVEIEDRMEQPDRVAQELKLRLGLNIQVDTVTVGSLPRFEGKGKRFDDQRHAKRD